MSNTIAAAIESTIANQIEKDQATMTQHIEDVENEQMRVAALIAALADAPTALIIYQGMIGERSLADTLSILEQRTDDDARQYVLGRKALMTAKATEAKAEQARIKKERIERERQEALQAWLAGVRVTTDLPAGIDKVVVSFVRTERYGIVPSITYSGHNNDRGIRQAKANGNTDPDAAPRASGRGRSTKVIVQDVEYSSFTSACKALGLPTGPQVNERKTLERHVKSHSLSMSIA